MGNSRNIKFIVVHCADTPEGRNVSTDEIKRWHMEERGWSDIGCHYVIEPSNKISKDSFCFAVVVSLGLPFLSAPPT